MAAINYLAKHLSVGWWLMITAIMGNYAMENLDEKFTSNLFKKPQKKAQKTDQFESNNSTISKHSSTKKNRDKNLLNLIMTRKKPKQKRIQLHQLLLLLECHWL
jgi:hypothetical protein